MGSEAVLLWRVIHDAGLAMFPGTEYLANLSIGDFSLMWIASGSTIHPESSEPPSTHSPLACSDAFVVDLQKVVCSTALGALR